MGCCLCFVNHSVKYLFDANDIGEEGQNAHCGTLCISMLNNGTFRVTLSLRREPDGGPVFCKMETNQRFKQLKTVKLHTNTTYRIDVSFKPPRALHSNRYPVQESDEFLPGDGGKDQGRVSLTCDGYGTARTAVPNTPGHRGPEQFLSWYLKSPNPLTPKGGMMDQAGYPGSSKKAHRTNGEAQAHRPRIPGAQTRRPKPHHSANAITRRLLNTLPHRIQPIGGPPSRDKLMTWAREPSPVYYTYNESGLMETYQFAGPPRALVAYVIMSRSLMIAGQEMEPSERFRDSTACAYSSYYNTDGLNHSKKGQREDLAIVMKVQETGELSTCLQVKLYKQRDTQHCEWGSQLHCVELDCCALEGDVSVRVNKETFK
uniref:CB1 cannabinoid receptor-interacting protein 1 n=1 Tax=Timema cristinae TaxID=61476 RepID=A0A7R9H145_TIMCR|nr:unnamed protein product [Timema cristinae]